MKRRNRIKSPKYKLIGAKFLDAIKIEQVTITEFCKRNGLHNSRISYLLSDKSRNGCLARYARRIADGFSVGHKINDLFEDF